MSERQEQYNAALKRLADDQQQPDPLKTWLTDNGLRLAYAISLRSANGSVVALADALKADYLSSNWTLVIDHKAVPEQKPE